MHRDQQGRDQQGRDQQGRGFRAAIVAIAVALALAACQNAPSGASSDASPAAQAASGAQFNRPSVAADQATFSFAEVTGIPADRADVMTQQFGLVAKSRGLKLVRRNDPTASYRIFASFKAFGDSSLVYLSYNLDIVNAQNKREFRINGTEPASGAIGDPWDQVKIGEMNQLAVRAIDQLATWVGLPQPGIPQPAKP